MKRLLGGDEKEIIAQAKQDIAECIDDDRLTRDEIKRNVEQIMTCLDTQIRYSESALKVAKMRRKLEKDAGCCFSLCCCCCPGSGSSNKRGSTLCRWIGWALFVTFIFSLVWGLYLKWKRDGHWGAV